MPAGYTVPDVSIIITNCNGNDLLDNCLSTFFKFSKGFSYEIIVVDNSTTEFPDTVVGKYSSGIELIKNTKNNSYSTANNLGIRAAKGEYILFLNNDIVFIENTILETLNFIKSKNEDAFVGCKILNADMSRQDSLVDFDNCWNEFTENFFLYKLFPRLKLFNKFYQNYIEINEPIEVDSLKGCFILAPLSTVRKLNGFDEDYIIYGEETDLCYRHKKNDGKAYYFPHTSIIHLGGATTDKVLDFKFRNQSISKVRFYQKNFKGMKRFCIISLHYTGVALRVVLYFLIGVFTFNKMFMSKSYYYIKMLFVYPPKVISQ